MTATTVLGLLILILGAFISLLAFLGAAKNMQRSDRFGDVGGEGFNRHIGQMKMLAVGGFVAFIGLVLAGGSFLSAVF